MATETSGPTLNRAYNDLLIRWGNAQPECEDCGSNLTGKRVHDTGTMWLGDCCKRGESDDTLSDAETRRAERQQMGICG